MDQDLKDSPQGRLPIKKMGWLTKLFEDYMLTKVLYAPRQKTTKLAGQTKEKTFYNRIRNTLLPQLTTI